MTLICAEDLKHQISLLIAAKPFDCDPFKDGQYAGLRATLRIIDAMPEVTV